MSLKADHSKTAYELLRKRDFHSPFTFADWQLRKKYMLLRDRLRERKYTTKDIGISYRVMTHWESSKLMPEGVNIGGRQKDSSWRTFSLVEMAWLKIIVHLRNFGFALKQIHTVKQQIISWNKKDGYYPNFEYCLAQALFSSKDTYLRILADGIADLVSTEQIEMTRILKGNDDMLLISIKSILFELKLDPKDTKSRLELSEEEFELFDEIKNRGNSEVRVGIKEGEITEIEASKIITNIPNNKAMELDIEKQEMFGRTVIQYEKGKKRSVQVVKRKRFDK